MRHATALIRKQGDLKNLDRFAVIEMRIITAGGRHTESRQVVFLCSCETFVLSSHDSGGNFALYLSGASCDHAACNTGIGIRGRQFDWYH